MDEQMDGVRKRREGREGGGGSGIRDVLMNQTIAFFNRISISPKLRWIEETAALQTYIDNVWS